MSDTSEKKVNWLAVLSILLALVLVTQTGAFIYYLNKKENSPQKTAAALDHHTNVLPQTAYPGSFFSRATHPRSAASQAAAYQDPWSVFDSMQEDMGRMMGGFMAGLPAMMSQMNQHMGFDSMPLVDLEEKDKAYIVRADIPGLDKDKIDITVRGEILTIQGVRETTTQNQGGSYYTQERSYGSFSRSMRLPGPVDEANIKAEYQNGVLVITLPKITEQEASKKVAIA